MKHLHRWPFHCPKLSEGEKSFDANKVDCPICLDELIRRTQERLKDLKLRREYPKKSKNKIE